MDYHIGIGDEELPVTELCLILNNALENAVEASLTMPEGERIIKVQATVRQNQFLLRVSNRFEGCLTAAGGLPVSTKEGTNRQHGVRVLEKFYFLILLCYTIIIAGNLLVRN